MEIVLASDLCAILFDSVTGCLIGIRDLERKVSLVDPAASPRLPFELHGLPDARLTDARPAPAAGGSSLRLGFDAGGLRVVLHITMGVRSALSLWSLDIRNPGPDARSFAVDFPVIEGTGGPLFSGGPQCPFQWAAAADPTGRAGLGVVVQDPAGQPKSFIVDGSRLRVRFEVPFAISAGRAVRLPETALLVSEPDWRPTARAHGAWRGSALRAAGHEQEQFPREWLLALRLSFPGTAFRTSDPVDASLAGVECDDRDGAADQGSLGRHWRCALETVRKALLRGEVCDDPRASDPGIATRLFRASDMEAAVFARPVEPGEKGSLAGYHAPYEVAIPVRGEEIPEVALCDLEDLSWQRHVPIVRDGCFRVDASSNWLVCLVLGRKTTLVGFDQPAQAAPGDMVVVRACAIAGTGRTKKVLFAAPGLISPFPVPVGGEISIHIPAGTAAGFYPLSLQGRNVPRFARLLHVLG
jgi:hypothetical protein